MSFPRLSGTKISLYLSFPGKYIRKSTVFVTVLSLKLLDLEGRKERPKAKKRRRLRRMKKLITRLWELRSIFAWEAPEGAKPRFGGMRGRRSASETKQEAREERAEAETGRGEASKKQIGSQTRISENYLPPGGFFGSRSLALSSYIAFSHPMSELFGG